MTSRPVGALCLFTSCLVTSVCFASNTLKLKVWELCLFTLLTLMITTYKDTCSIWSNVLVLATGRAQCYFIATLVKAFTHVLEVL